MTTQDLLNRIAALPDRPRDRPTAPPVEVIAFMVAWHRRLRDWKQSTLADFAGVSISTIQRLERGEMIGSEALDKIAAALGYRPGEFAKPRLPLTREQVASSVTKTLADLVSVPVRRLRSQRAVRELLRCQSVIVHRPEVPKELDTEIKTLQDWLSVGSSLLSDPIDHEMEGVVRRRDLYRKILAQVADIERQGMTVLSGAIAMSEMPVPNWSVAVISVTPKSADPAAMKRRHLMVDRKIFEPTVATTT